MVGISGAGQCSPPRWPTWLLTVMALIAGLSVAQGMVDVVVPTLRGEEPFRFLYEQTQRFGPAFFVGYVFLHNLGLACVVPGFGFVAARFERETRNRRLIGLILMGSVVASLLIALEFLFQAAERFDLPVALGIFAAEAVAVLSVAVTASRQLKGFVPTPRYAWSLVTPFRRLGAPLAFAATTLLVMSVVEAAVVLSG